MIDLILENLEPKELANAAKKISNTVNWLNNKEEGYSKKRKAINKIEKIYFEKTNTRILYNS